MKTNIVSKNRTAATLVFSLSFLVVGCNENAQTGSIRGTIQFIGGAGVPENEKIDLKVDASGNGYLRGSVGHVLDDGSITAAGSETTCEVLHQDQTNIVGSVDVYGVRVVERGELSFPFDPTDGYFRAEAGVPCVFRRGRIDAIDYTSNPDARVSAQLIPNAETCSTFCQARAAADCENQDASCILIARQSCSSDCNKPGTLIVSSRGAAIDWEDENLEGTAEADINPGDPIMGDDGISAATGRVDIVLDQLQVPVETMIGTSFGDSDVGTCLTVVGNKVEDHPCDPTLETQRFLIETVGRYATAIIEHERLEDPRIVAGTPDWISGKPQQRIRRGVQCLSTTSDRLFSTYGAWGNIHADILMSDCATSTAENQRFFFGRNEEERFSVVTSVENALAWLWGDTFARVRMTINDYNGGYMNRGHYAGDAPGLIHLLTPETTATPTEE